jgi:purine-nucleoside phosphorylase
MTFPPEPRTVEPTIAYLRERVTRAPTAAIVLGSGLSGVAAEIRDPLVIPFADIPGLPRTSVAGHEGALLFGVWEGVEVAVMQGRFHLYEGWPAETVALPLRALRALGASHLLITNAAGALRADLGAGDLMLIADHINLTFRNPLIGSVALGGDRFTDMSDPYDSRAREIALRAAEELRIRLSPGVYAAVLGPSFETPAELEMLRRLGVDAVGMSTVPEVIVGRALSMRVLGISCITNAPPTPGREKLTHEEVLRVAGEVSGRLSDLLRVILPRWVPPNLASEAAT